jgi:N-acetylglucosaminyl-diphospho-decaprenol L-rhamnosyltransferase
MRLALIIVNYRSAGLCTDCLDSLSATSIGGDFDVDVLDAASGDDSVAKLREHIARRGYAAWCKLTPLDRNGGFAFANNCAIRPILAAGPRAALASADLFTIHSSPFTIRAAPASDDPPEFFLLLNPDTVVRPGAIQTLVEFLKTHPNAGIVGARLEDPDGTSQRSAFNFPSVFGEFELSVRLGLFTRLFRRWRIAPAARDEAHRCGWVAGACMLIRREVFEQIGLLDEGYFMYYEEVDFCRRAAKQEFECWYEPSARVVHLVGQSSGVTDTKRPPRRLPAYWFESRRRYFEKNHGVAYRIAADLAWTLGQTIHALYRPLRGKPNTDPPFMIRDFLSHALARRGDQSS